MDVLLHLASANTSETRIITGNTDACVECTATGATCACITAVCTAGGTTRTGVTTRRTTGGTARTGVTARRTTGGATRTGVTTRRTTGSATCAGVTARRTTTRISIRVDLSAKYRWCPRATYQAHIEIKFIRIFHVVLVS